MGRDALIGFGESDESMIPEENSDPDKSEHTIEYNPNVSSPKPTIAPPPLNPDLTKAKQSSNHQPKLNLKKKKENTEMHLFVK